MCVHLSVCYLCLHKKKRKIAKAVWTKQKNQKKIKTKINFSASDSINSICIYCTCHLIAVRWNHAIGYIKQKFDEPFVNFFIVKFIYLCNFAIYFFFYFFFFELRNFDSHCLLFSLFLQHIDTYLCMYWQNLCMQLLIWWQPKMMHYDLFCSMVRVLF